MPPQSPADALGVSRRVLRILIKLNLLIGFLILALLVASLVAPEFVMRALGVAPADDNGPLFLGMRLIMVIGIAAVAITHTVLARLSSVVDTVWDGDPFIVENAVRLRTIAWTVLALEVLHVVVVLVAANVSTPTTRLDIGWNFSVTRWLAVLLLFVLARVFEHGSRMRADLEGTV